MRQRTLARASRLSCLLLLASRPASAASATQKQAEREEVRVTLPDGGRVLLSTRGPSAFRARLLLDGQEDRGPIDSPMVAPDGADAPFTKVHWQSLGENTACRVNSSDTSKDGLGTTQNKTDSLETCKSFCEQASGCTGIEYSHKHRRCEFWSQPIGATKHREGSHCLNVSRADEGTRGISVVGLGSLSVSPQGRLTLRGPRGELLTESEPLDGQRRPPESMTRSRHPGGWFQGTPSASGDEQIWSGDMVYLRAHTGRYVEVEGDKVQARWEERGEWQGLSLETRARSGLIRHGDIVYLHTHTGSAVDVHHGRVRARWDVHGQWQEFVIERKFGSGVVQSGDPIYLKANEGHYVDVEDTQVAARWEEHGKWQTLTIEKSGPAPVLQSGDGIYLQDFEGRLLAPGEPQVSAKRASRSAPERWVLDKKDAQTGSRIASGDTVFLMSRTGLAMDVEMGAVQTKTAGRETWQQLVVERRGGAGPVRQGDEVQLRTHEGLYITVQGDKVTATSPMPTTTQTFSIEARVPTCIQTSALNGSISASSWHAEDAPWKAVDGDMSTGWVSNASDDQWLAINFGEVYSLSRVEARWGQHFAKRYFVEGSHNGEDWDILGLALGADGWVVTNLPHGSRARWVRLRADRAGDRERLSESAGRGDFGRGYEVTEMVVHACQSTVTFSSQGGHLFGRGGATYDTNRLTATAVQPQVWNRATFVPYLYSTDGYGALGVVENRTNLYSRQVYPASYAMHHGELSWGFSGAFELYFMPASSLAAGTRAFFDLTGSPRVPPRHAFGFIASRWGWQSRDYIEDTLARFRQDRYPLDSIVFDFEWFTNESDYDFSSEGKDWYQDFGFHNQTLPDPQKQLHSYQRKLHVRTGGVRKPRLGNSKFLAMAHKKGWLLPGGSPGGQYPPDLARSYAYGRNLDFSIPEVRDWYADKMLPLIEHGVDFWWNDEGETDYFTYFWWNLAQVQALRSRKNQSETEPHKRFFSLNRAFSPGLARLGATVWTGEITPSWEDLHRTPGIMLNWGLAGAPYVACDIGGFSGETEPKLLTRWMQVGVFLPTMRVHSWLWAHPHWPWLYGGEAAVAIRRALELRYCLVPYHYSLAHTMFTKRTLWMRPLVMEFPEDKTAASLTTEWMDGNMLVAPVLREDGLRQIYLPEGIWYHFNTSRTTEGPVHLGGKAAMEEIPAFVRPGTVLPLAPIVQSTDLLPGGPLEVQVYTGADGSFELVEDDGESVAYEVGRVRTTSLRWYDSAKTLSWRARGSPKEPGVRAFKELRVTLFNGDSHQTVRLPAQPLRDGGSISHGELHV